MRKVHFRVIYFFGDNLLGARGWPDSSASNVLDPQSIPAQSILAGRLMISYFIPNRTIQLHPLIRDFVYSCSFSSGYVQLDLCLEYIGSES